MTEKLKMAILGAGTMAEYHVKGFREAGADVVAVADRNPATARAFAEKHGIPLAVRDLDEMLEKVRPDGISVITPNKYHKALSIAALEKGIHVFCEKPPALNAAETEEMARAAKTHGKLLTFDFNNRARLETRAVMDYIEHGDCGVIHSAQATWIRRAGIPGFGGWFTDRSIAGGGPLIDLLHMLDLALYFMGEPEPEYILAQTFDDMISNRDFKGVWGIPDGAHGVNNVENACHAMIRFRTGQILEVRSSWAEMVEREEISVLLQGSKAGAMIRRRFDADGLDLTSHDDTRLFTCEYGRQVNRIITTPKDPDMGRTRSAANFAAAVAGREKPLVKVEEAVLLMRIIDGIYLSASSGRPVCFGPEGPQAMRSK